MLTWSFSLCVQLCVQVPLLVAGNFEMSLRSQEVLTFTCLSPLSKGVRLLGPVRRHGQI